MKHELASDFKPLPGEATFPPTIEQEVVGGTHIAPECVLKKGQTFFMTVWPTGLPRHETTRTVRFPHGLIRFGETIEICAQRLVHAQIGLKVEEVRVLKIDSYLDDKNHWHIEPILLVEASGDPTPPDEAGGYVTFQGTALPQGAVWGQESFARLVNTYIFPR